MHVYNYMHDSRYTVHEEECISIGNILNWATKFSENLSSSKLISLLICQILLQPSAICFIIWSTSKLIIQCTYL